MVGACPVRAVKRMRKNATTLRTTNASHRKTRTM
jgi:hypothetical protein